MPESKRIKPVMMYIVKTFAHRLNTIANSIMAWRFRIIVVRISISITWLAKFFLGVDAAMLSSF